MVDLPRCRRTHGQPWATKNSDNRRNGPDGQVCVCFKRAPHFMCKTYYICRRHRGVGNDSRDTQKSGEFLIGRQPNVRHLFFACQQVNGCTGDVGWILWGCGYAKPRMLHTTRVLHTNRVGVKKNIILSHPTPHNHPTPTPHLPHTHPTPTPRPPHSYPTATPRWVITPPPLNLHFFRASDFSQRSCVR